MFENSTRRRAVARDVVITVAPSIALAVCGFAVMVAAVLGASAGGNIGLIAYAAAVAVIVVATVRVLAGDGVRPGGWWRGWQWALCVTGVLACASALGLTAPWGMFVVLALFFVLVPAMLICALVLIVGACGRAFRGVTGAPRLSFWRVVAATAALAAVAAGAAVVLTTIPVHHSSCHVEGAGWDNGRENQYIWTDCGRFALSQSLYDVDDLRSDTAMDIVTRGFGGGALTLPAVAELRVSGD